MPARVVPLWRRRFALGGAIAALVVLPLIPGALATGSVADLVRIPVESIVALRPALVERSNESAGFGTTDWMTIAAIERPAIHRFTNRFESREQRHARLWVNGLRQEEL